MADLPQPSEEPPVDGAAILVVEDDVPLARLMEALLESAGYRVVSVGDGEAALTSLQEDRPALMLLDLTLPRLDGWEVLERLRGVRGAPPVILFTGHHAAIDRALSAGAAAAILKPFDVDDLLDTVERLIEQGS
jgi:DNA-binding response OmpR family regulator